MTPAEQSIHERELKIASYKEDSLEKVKDILWVVFRIQDIDAEKTYKYIDDGIQICNSLNYSSQKHKLLAYQGAMYEKEYRLDDALLNYHTCATYFKKEKDEWMYSNMLDSIAGIYTKSNKKVEAFNLYRQIIKITKKLNKPDELFLGLLNIISLSIDLKRFKLAKNYLGELQKLQSSLTYLSETAPIYIQYYEAKFALIAKDSVLALDYIQKTIDLSETKIELQYEKAMCLALRVEINSYQRNLEAMLSDIREIRNIKSVSVTSYLREALTTLYNYYERTKKYKAGIETLKELFYIRENEFISKKLTDTIDISTQSKANTDSRFIHIQDIHGITSRIEQNDMTNILYDNRILKIYLTDETTILKQGSLSDFMNMLQTQKADDIVRISRTEAVNLFYMESYNSTTKELILDIFGKKQKFKVAQRQEKYIRNFKN